MRKAIWVTAGFLTSTMALAADSGAKPGYWDYSMKTEIPGMPFAMPPMNFKKCLTQQDVDKGNYSQDPNHKSDCEITNMKHSGAKTSYDVACKGDHPMTGHYDFTTTADSLSGAGTMTGGEQTIKTNFTAKRLGDCP